MSYITEAELKELKEITNLVNSFELEYGSKTIQIQLHNDEIKLLESEAKTIFEQYKSAKELNDKLIQKLIETYGNCQINLDTGQIS